MPVVLAIVGRGKLNGILVDIVSKVMISPIVVSNTVRLMFKVSPAYKVSTVSVAFVKINFGKKFGRSRTVMLNVKICFSGFTHSLSLAITLAVYGVVRMSLQSVSQYNSVLEESFPAEGITKAILSTMVGFAISEA